MRMSFLSCLSSDQLVELVQLTAHTFGKLPEVYRVHEYRFPTPLALRSGVSIETTAECTLAGLAYCTLSLVYALQAAGAVSGSIGVLRLGNTPSILGAPPALRTPALGSSCHTRR